MLPVRDNYGKNYLKDRLTIGIPAHEHDGFTDEELDFIPSASLRTGINYDIKYRMGKELD